MITKIKINDKENKTKIIYETMINKGSKQTTFESTELATREWLDCLQVLKDFVCRILELPESYKETMRITGLTIKYEDEGTGYVISAQKGLYGVSAPLCLNTPYLAPARQFSDSVVDVQTEKEIDKILNMAKDFLNGKYRAQGEMF